MLDLRDLNGWTCACSTKDAVQINSAVAMARGLLSGQNPPMVLSSSLRNISSAVTVYEYSVWCKLYRIYTFPKARDRSTLAERLVIVEKKPKHELSWPLRFAVAQICSHPQQPGQQE
jgi:hypothetical protein